MNKTTINGTSFLNALYKRLSDTDLSKKDIKTVLDGYKKLVTFYLSKHAKISFINFGSFKVGYRKARMGRNPQNGQTIKISARYDPLFKAGKALKQAVNK